jgi:hypothetical protein
VSPGIGGPEAGVGGGITAGEPGFHIRPGCKPGRHPRRRPSLWAGKP